MTSREREKDSMISRWKSKDSMISIECGKDSMSRNEGKDPVFKTFHSLCLQDYTHNYPEESRKVPAKFIEAKCLERWETMTKEEQLPFIKITNDEKKRKTLRENVTISIPLLKILKM